MLVLKLENKLIKEPIGPTAVECSRFLIPINSLQSSEGRGQTSERQTTAAAAATPPFVQRDPYFQQNTQYTSALGSVKISSSMGLDL